PSSPDENIEIGRPGDCSVPARPRTVRPRGSPPLPGTDLPLVRRLFPLDVELEMEEVARIVLALETADVAEEVMHLLDRTGRARVVGTAVDASQLAEAVRQLEPDAVVAAPSLVPSRGSLNGCALFAVDTSQSVGGLRRAIRGGAIGFFLWPAEREELAIAAGRVGSKPDESTAERAQVIAVYAARGGAGATFVATHLA